MNANILARMFFPNAHWLCLTSEYEKWCYYKGGEKFYMTVGYGTGCYGNGQYVNFLPVMAHYDLVVCHVWFSSNRSASEQPSKSWGVHIDALAFQSAPCEKPQFFERDIDINPEYAIYLAFPNAYMLHCSDEQDLEDYRFVSKIFPTHEVEFVSLNFPQKYEFYGENYHSVLFSVEEGNTQVKINAVCFKNEEVYSYFDTLARFTRIVKKNTPIATIENPYERAMVKFALGRYMSEEDGILAVLHWECAQPYWQRLERYMRRIMKEVKYTNYD